MKQQPLVLFLDPAAPTLEATLRELGFRTIDLTRGERAEIDASWPEAVGVVIRSSRSLDRTWLAAAPDLRFIARVGIGLEHIDLQAAYEQGIQVFNSPEASGVAVAEHAMGMLLNLLHHIGRSDRDIRQGKWQREPNRGTELRGKTVGIIGYGSTGQLLAQRLAGFDCTVLCYDKYRRDYGDNYAVAKPMEYLFEQADVVSLHIWYDTNNHYLVNSDWLTRFRRPIYFLNTARGLLVDTQALADALASGKVAGAALDVLEYEHKSFEHLSLDELPAPFQYLRQSDRVVLTPHIAGWSHRAKSDHAAVLAQKISQWWQDGGLRPTTARRG